MAAALDFFLAVSQWFGAAVLSGLLLWSAFWMFGRIRGFVRAYAFVWTTAAMRVSIRFGLPSSVVSVPFQTPYYGWMRERDVGHALDFKAWAEERGFSLCLDSDFAPRDVPGEFVAFNPEIGTAHIGPADAIRRLRAGVESRRRHKLRCGACSSGWMVDGSVRADDTVCPRCGASTLSSHEVLDMMGRGKISPGEGRSASDLSPLFPPKTSFVRAHGQDVG